MIVSKHYVIVVIDGATYKSDGGGGNKSRMLPKELDRRGVEKRK